eukprot:CAMPEP_0174853506 /NCGR_PEP_ID=MMETSP1114-20130205/28762_1 /TAXON_ID=312471 /ORGANISM="Neobodo designis, Strain CCAP 1951/1" /LENGTH=37 /DNA_ID= /DNA_START= /DNA_END= /DNA_ORIENTATION=
MGGIVSAEPDGSANHLGSALSRAFSAAPATPSAASAA